MSKTASSGYIELHCNSVFSFLYGASLPATLAARAAEIGLPALALCDRGGFYGSPRFWFAAVETGIRAIYGCELEMEDGSMLPVLIRDVCGYQNICQLITRSKLRSPKRVARIFWDELWEFADGTVCLTGGEDGPIVQALLHEDFERAENTVRQLISIFGTDNVFVEIQRHFRRGEGWLNKCLVDLARTTGTKLLATNGVLYADPAGRRIADIFTCARLHTHLDEAGIRLALNSERHLKSPAEMRALFADLPEATENTVRLADSLQFAFPNIGYEFPSYKTPDGKTEAGLLWEVTLEGARKRYQGAFNQKVQRQLERELKLIIELGFEGYFLMVWDIIRFCRENDILAQGRGSAANSAVCYSLEITAVDPISSNLLFERFLNENRSGINGGRKSWPDIDLDLPSGERREKVIQEMYRRCGRDGVGMTANVITFKGRGTMREIGKALNLPVDILNRFSSLFHSGDFPHTLGTWDQFQRAGLEREHPRAAACMEMFQAIHGLPRHLGQHSGGMVFCQHRLDSVVPLENSSMPNRSVIQWDKDDCEELGLVKVDLLGLGMMAVIQDTLEVCRVRQRPIDLPRLPKDDEPTFEAMRRSDTIGVFQIESRAQMTTLARHQPRTFYDVVVQVAIVRPGPIEGGLMHPYMARRQGKMPVRYLDERLKPILERTLGVCIFQEQMMSVAMRLANFSAAEVDELRRALNYKRDSMRLQRMQAKLRAALERENLSRAAVEEIVKMTESFALYGFPESHAASFGLLAYASTYLKVHRAVEFTCGLLNNQPMGFYSSDTLINDARRHGIRVHPVCTERSDWLCIPEGDHDLRMGFNQINGFRQERAAVLTSQRHSTPFKSLADFRIRTRFSKDELRALARLGALNNFCGHRRSALWQIEHSVPEQGEFVFDDRLVSDSLETGTPLKAMDAIERLQADYRSQRLTTGPHPMKLMRELVPDAWKAEDVAEATHGDVISIAGMVKCRQRPGTAKGAVFISLEDESGIANAVISPRLFEQMRLLVSQESFLQITGSVVTKNGLPMVQADKIEAVQSPLLSGVFSYDFH